MHPEEASPIKKKSKAKSAKKVPKKAQKVEKARKKEKQKRQSHSNDDDDDGGMEGKHRRGKGRMGGPIGDYEDAIEWQVAQRLKTEREVERRMKAEMD